MFKIKSEQIRLFQPDAEEAFVVRVMDYLKERHPDAAVQFPEITSRVAELPDETLQKTVRGGLERGREYGIEWKSTLLSFVVLLFIVAPNFDRHPKARDFFARTETIDDAALESLIDEMTDEDWTAIEKRYDPEALNLTTGEEEKI
jgi:hypothetical protein